jgi:hypothetical protein
MMEMRTKRLYITRPGIDAFSCGIRPIYLCSGVNIKLEISTAEKRYPFPALADLRRFLRNWSLSVTLSIPTLLGIKPVSISTKIADGRGLQW